MVTSLATDLSGCVLTWQDQCQPAEGRAENQCAWELRVWVQVPGPGLSLVRGGGRAVTPPWIREWWPWPRLRLSTQATILPAASRTTRDPLRAAWRHHFILVPFGPALFSPPGLLTTFFLAPRALTSRLCAPVAAVCKTPHGFSGVGPPTRAPVLSK